MLFMKNADCGFFRWEEELEKINVSSKWEELRANLLQNEKVIAKLEVEKKILDEKVKKLKMKRDNLEEAIQDMRNELCHLCATVLKYARGEKFVALAVVMSWLIFAIVVIIRNL